MLDNQRLRVSSTAPYDLLQAFVRENHIALEGSSSGPLDDLVFAIKDVLKVKGSTIGNGHPEWLRTHEPDDFTSSIVLSMLDAGADLVGKTVCDELCNSISGENWNYGSPLNPQDPRRFTGGSSSGACAATAGGLVDFAFGSDCLGSVRVPASYTGILGIRPTYKRVPTDGEVSYCESMDVLGFVGNTPEIFKRVAKEVFGEDKMVVPIHTLLIAEDCFNKVDQDVTDALQPAIEHMSKNVETVKRVVLHSRDLSEWSDIFKVVQGFEIWDSYGGWIRKYHPQLSPGPKERLEWMPTITVQEYRDAYTKRQTIIDRVTELLKPGCVLVLPTAASVAPLRSNSLEETNRTRLQSIDILCISPLSGTPQVTIPLVQQHEVPLGISIIGAAGADLAMVNFAADMVESFTE